MRAGKSIGGWSSAIVAGLIIALLAPAATASIKIQESETLSLLEEFEQAKCRTKTKAFGFVALSLPANDLYTLDVFITKAAWKGFGHTYNLFYGNEDVQINVFGPNGELFSNEYGLPGTPDGTVGAGGIKISENGKKFSVGAYGLPDATFNSGVATTGAAKCKYPRRR